MLDEELQRAVWDRAFGQEGDTDPLTEEELEYRMAQLQDLRCGLKQVAGGTEVDGARLGGHAAQVVPQEVQRVLVHDDPALAGVVAVATDVAVGTVVQAARREVDGGQCGETGEAR